MSSKRYADVHDNLNDEQINAIWRCWEQGINHDGHVWVTWTDVEELVADLFEVDKWLT